MNRPMLEIRALRVHRNGRLTLDIPSLRVMPGERLAVMGPNGAGKSTLLLAAAGLLPESFGRVWLDGQVFTHRSALTLRRRLALVLQTPLLLNASVYENVAVGLRFRHLPRAEIRQRTEAWLERLGVAHLAQRRALQLSGGEAQRVSLARAFALQPDLLLLDEPFNGLDAPTRAALLEDLHSLLHTSRMTVLLVTHYEDETRRLAEQTLHLEQGRITPHPAGR